MSYINKTVSVYGTEVEFMQTLASELHSADSRIVCETDIEAEFSKENTYKPIIVFNINNCYKINFKRYAQISTGVTRYYITCTVNGTETETISEMSFMQTTSGYSKSASRCYKFSIVNNTNFLSISFARYNYTLPSQVDVNLFSYHKDNFNIVSLAEDSKIPATECQMIRTDEVGRGDIYTFATRFNYSRGENVEFVKSKVFVRSDNAEQDIEDIIDCSAVSKGSVVNINGIKYYALDSHTLAKM